jgi:hypothetical protein
VKNALEPSSLSNELRLVRLWSRLEATYVFADLACPPLADYPHLVSGSARSLLSSGAYADFLRDSAASIRS